MLSCTNFTINKANLWKNKILTERESAYKKKAGKIDRKLISELCDRTIRALQL
jgi:hypothetical protein